MEEKMSGIPNFLQSSLWSYDVKKLNSQRNKNLIITQVLNYGTTDQVKWILHTYPDQEIKEVVKNPSRGIWWPEALNFWTKIFKLKIDKDIYEMALFRLGPAPAEKLARWWKILEKRKHNNLSEK